MIQLRFLGLSVFNKESQLMTRQVILIQPFYLIFPLTDKKEDTRQDLIATMSLSIFRIIQELESITYPVYGKRDDIDLYYNPATKNQF
jgi:hypothetical protein